MSLAGRAAPQEGQANATPGSKANSSNGKTNSGTAAEGPNPPTSGKAPAQENAPVPAETSAAAKPKTRLEKVVSFFVHNNVTAFFGVHDALKSIANKFGLRACFAACTPLRTANGWKNIEDFVQGDKVLSRDENVPDGPVEEKWVEAIFVRTGRIRLFHCPLIRSTTSTNDFGSIVFTH